MTDLPQIANNIQNLKPYVPGKPIEETQREYGLKSVIKLASNENPLGVSPKVLQAVKKAMKELHRYPDASGFRLKSALSKQFKILPSQICLGNGSNEVMDTAMRSFCVPGDQVVTSQAAFIAFEIAAQTQGVEVLKAPLDKDLKFDLAALLNLVRQNSKVKMVYLPNPNNPTGTYINERELRIFLQELKMLSGRPVLCLLDYAYIEYVTASDFPDGLKMLEEYPNLILLKTFSKVYGLAGLRVGYAIARPELIAIMEKVRLPFHVNHFGLVAAEAALSDKAFVRRARLVNSSGQAYWSKNLSTLGIPFVASQGNFMLFNCKKGMGLSGSELNLLLLKRGIILRPVANYGLDDYIRASIGTPVENRRAISVIKEIKENHKK